MILMKSFNGLFKKCSKTVTRIQSSNIHNRNLIGNRDWVCFAKNGTAYYKDDFMYPCPAIRFKENTNELLALREKEKGDWRKLSLEEKKTLYRASFRQTLAELEAPTGEWKTVAAMVFLLMSVGTWMFIGIKLFLLNKPQPTLTEEWRRATLRRMLDLKIGHLTGVSSKWDYENDTWKK